MVVHDAPLKVWIILFLLPIAPCDFGNATNGRGRGSRALVVRVILIEIILIRVR